MLMKYVITLLVLSLFLGSCKNEEEKEIGPCDNKYARYRADIKPIIAKNCAGCHNEYLVYENLNEICNNGKFFKRVIYLHDMPPTGMDTCELITLRRWYYNGHTSY
jgi:hypothetical protein